MPDSVSEERRKLVCHYGAKVILVHDDGDIGKCIEECLQTAIRMQQKNPDIFIPQQFENPANPDAHRLYTGKEILSQVDGPIHGFCAGIGTGGTISGIGEVLKEANPDIEIWAVEPENAAILSGGNIGTHLQMGIGDGLIPENLNTKIYSDIYIVSDKEAIHTSRALARKVLCAEFPPVPMLQLQSHLQKSLVRGKLLLQFSRILPSVISVLRCSVTRFSNLLKSLTKTDDYAIIKDLSLTAILL